VNSSLKSRGINLFQDSNFASVMTALDASMKLSTRSGTNLKRSSAEFITLDEEDELWRSGCLGETNPDVLRDTLFYLNGVHFALRGGDEQANLLISQFTIDIVEGKRVLRYTDVASKTFSGGLRNQRNKPKEVMHFENVEDPSRCHVTLFEKYMLRRPPGVDRFYLQTAKDWKQDCLWYTTRPG
jgi:hypothetical protein